MLGLCLRLWPKVPLPRSWSRGWDSPRSKVGRVRGSKALNVLACAGYHQHFRHFLCQYLAPGEINVPFMRVGLGDGCGGSPDAVSSTIIGGGSDLERCRPEFAIVHYQGNLVKLDAKPNRLLRHYKHQKRQDGMHDEGLTNKHQRGRRA